MEERLNNWIEKLNLIKHPEGGYFSEIYRSRELIDKHALPERFNGSRAFSTSIYFVITNTSPSKFHKIKADEIWHFYDGGNIILHIIDPQGNYAAKELGFGEYALPQQIIPAMHWMAAEITGGKRFSLLGCTSAPGFEFEDFKLAKKEDILNLNPDLEDLVTKLT